MADRRSLAYLSPKAEFIYGNVRDAPSLREALQGVEIGFHQAAEVGVGQSMYEITRYVDANTGGTAALLELLANEPHTVHKLIVASSMSIYGEGAYECPVHGPVYPQLRPDEQLQACDWEVRCPIITDGLIPNIQYPTRHAACHSNQFPPTRTNPSSPPASTPSRKWTRSSCAWPSVGRTGFRVRANLLALERDEANSGVFNVGTGRPRTVLGVAYTLAEGLSGRYRA